MKHPASILMFLLLGLVHPAISAPDKKSPALSDTLPIKTADTPPVPETGISKTYLFSYLHDGGRYLSSPLRWRTREWLTVTLVSAGIGGLYLFDGPVRDWVQRNRNPVTDAVSTGVQPFGNGWVIVPSLAALYAGGIVFQKERPRMVALYGAEAALFAGLLTNGIKLSAHRHRPYENDGPGQWDGPSLTMHHLSFPSGHTTGAFAIASVTASVYNDKPVIGVVAYALATLTALSRINDDRHWISDVALGSAIGVATGLFIVKAHGASGSEFSLKPAVIDGNPGVLLVGQW